jgi:hypothetical protein
MAMAGMLVVLVVVVDVLAGKTLFELRVLAKVIVIPTELLVSMQVVQSLNRSFQSSPSLNHAPPVPTAQPRHRHRKQSSTPDTELAQTYSIQPPC